MLNEIIEHMGIKPYYQDDDGVIFNADCLDIMKQMPEKCVDLTMADPPYNAKDIGPNKRVYIEGQMQLPIKEYKLFCENWFQGAFPVSENIILTPGISNICYYPQPFWVLCWHKPAAVSFNRLGGYNAWEPIFIYGKTASGERLGQDYILFNTLNFNKGPEKNHPCPKPLGLWSLLISKFTKSGDIILDPFLGSGTTAVAAKQLGRKYIGIEISEAYCKIAVQRLAQEILI